MCLILIAASDSRLTSSQTTICFTDNLFENVISTSKRVNFALRGKNDIFPFLKNLDHVGDIESLFYIENLIVSKDFRRFRVIQYTADHIPSAVLISILHYSHCSGTFHSMHGWVMQQDST